MCRRRGNRTPWIAALVAVTACSPGEPARSPGLDTTAASVPPADAVLGASWSHDGTRLAVSWLRGRRARVYGVFGPAADSILPTPSRGRPITAGQGFDATWSPDGLWVAFATTRTGNSEIYRVRPDGTGPESLTRSPSNEGEPAYSPDGRFIAFTSDGGGKGSRVYVMRANGRDPHPVAEDLPGTEQHAPAWSPDGRVLAFTVREGADTVIWVDSLSGGRRGRLGEGHEPAWSADGTQVFFTQGDSVFVRPAAGGPASLVVADARAPAPSPRGRWLAFVRGSASASALYLLDLRTNVAVRITS
jgi:Tol biopolymer transport system component